MFSAPNLKALQAPPPHFRGRSQMDKVATGVAMVSSAATGVEADEGGSSLPSPRTGIKLRSEIGEGESSFSGVFST